MHDAPYHPTQSCKLLLLQHLETINSTETYLTTLKSIKLMLRAKLDVVIAELIPELSDKFDFILHCFKERLLRK